MASLSLNLVLTIDSICYLNAMLKPFFRFKAIDMAEFI